VVGITLTVEIIHPVIHPVVIIHPVVSIHLVMAVPLIMAGVQLLFILRTFSVAMFSA
jgi:hypothetical protein